jgi:hypothetical protein
MMIVTLLLIALTVAVPDIFTQGRREREEELIFRGNQYARAVGMFHDKFNRYPTTVKELLQTNGIRFLRKEFKDPMTKGGKWRFVHISAAGVLIDSKDQGIAGANPLGQAALGSAAGNSGGFGQSQFGQSQSGSMFGSSQPGQSMFGSSSFGQPQANGDQPPPPPPAGDNGQTSQAGQPGQPGQPDQSGSAGAGGQDQGGQSGIGSGSAFGQGQVFGAGIAGVASTSHHASIRIWNHKKHYDEWEFLGILAGTGGALPGTGLQAPQGSPTQGPTTQNPLQPSQPPPAQPPTSGPDQQ